jgi:dihydropteroate synthase
MPAPRHWLVRGRTLTLDRPLVMGVVNVTPDSFSDGGRYLSAHAALEHARRLLHEGADILDLGAESTRPQGATPVSAADELERLEPVMRALVAELPDAVISVDTVKAEVAERMLAAGAHIVNDVSALRLDPRMAGVVAASGAGVILMHSRGGVADMATYAHADYEGDVLDVVERELESRLRAADAAGIAPGHIAVDPGLGFSKRPEASLRMLGGLARLARWGHPVAVGASRKRFVGTITGVTDAAARVHGSVGAAVAAYERGAAIFRVHDVAATRQALDVAAAARRAAGAVTEPVPAGQPA